MASYQRRRGVKVIVYGTKVVTNTRGEQVSIVDLTDPHELKVAMIPLRSSHAEIAGQLDLDAVRMIVDASVPNVDSFGRVLWDGVVWDIVSPPARHGLVERHTRHWSMDLRRRSDG